MLNATSMKMYSYMPWLLSGLKLLARYRMMRFDARIAKSIGELTLIQNTVPRVHVMHHIALKKFPTMNHGPMDFTIAPNCSVLMYWQTTKPANKRYMSDQMPNAHEAGAILVSYYLATVPICFPTVALAAIASTKETTLPTTKSIDGCVSSTSSWNYILFFNLNYKTYFFNIFIYSLSKFIKLFC